MGFHGIEHYYYGPKLHQFLKEVQEKAFTPHGAFSVGETPGIGRNMCQLITGEERKELDMVFSFDQLETPGHVRMDDYEYDLNYYRDYMIDWITNYGNNCWMSIFYNNHDNPRMISKITKNGAYHTQLSKLLAVMQLTLKGTPFIFQGDEMGLANYAFTSMDQITDVEAKGYYAEHIEKKSHEEVFATILAGTREHCRVLLPWNDKLPEYHTGLKQPTKPEVLQA
jgi:oligo-1,6-glucosidase